MKVAAWQWQMMPCCYAPASIRSRGGQASACFSGGTRCPVPFFSSVFPIFHAQCVPIFMFSPFGADTLMVILSTTCCSSFFFKDGFPLALATTIVCGFPPLSLARYVRPAERESKSVSVPGAGSSFVVLGAHDPFSRLSTAEPLHLLLTPHATVRQASLETLSPGAIPRGPCLSSGIPSSQLPLGFSSSLQRLVSQGRSWRGDAGINQANWHNLQDVAPLSQSPALCPRTTPEPIRSMKRVCAYRRGENARVEDVTDVHRRSPPTPATAAVDRHWNDAM